MQCRLTVSANACVRRRCWAHLRVEAKVDHVAEEVQVPLRLHEAAHVRHRRQQLVSLRQHARDDRVEGPLPARTILARVLWSSANQQQRCSNAAPVPAAIVRLTRPPAGSDGPPPG